MSRTDKRQRTQYVVAEWSPLVADVRLPNKQQGLLCRSAVIVGDVLKWAPAATRYGTRLQIGSETPVTGWWLPARFVIDSKFARYVVDVDLVAHATARTLHKRTKRIKDVPPVSELGAPAKFSRLHVYDADGETVLSATHMTRRYEVQVTRLLVLPPSTQGGQRSGERAIVKSVPVSVGDLLNVALNAARLGGVVYPPLLARTHREVGRLKAGVHNTVSRFRQGATKRRVHDDELLRQVRDVHEHAPHGGKVRAVQDHFDLGRSNAAKIITQSQLRLKWGAAHARRSKTHNKRKKQGRS